MNHIYKSIFNKALGVFTAVPEFASAHGKGSERTVVGRVAKGTAGFADSALAISVGLALTSTSAVAAPGIFINNGQDPACLAVIDDVATSALQLIYGGSKTIYPAVGVAAGSPLGTKSNFELDARNPCLPTGGTDAENHNTQTNRTLFYNSKNLTLGGRLDVNSGIIGVGDRGADGAGATNSIRMGTGTTLDDTNKHTNAIAIGVDTATTAEGAVAISAEAKARTSYSIAIGRNATAGGDMVPPSNETGGAIAIGRNSLSNYIGAIALGNGAQVSSAKPDGKTTDGIAIGTQALVDNYRGMAIGAQSQAKGSQSIVLANNAPNAKVSVASGIRSQVYGVESEASGTDAVAIGYKNTVAAHRTYAIGNEINVAKEAEEALAFGTRAHVSGAYQISLGSDAGADAVAPNTSGIAIGRNAGRYGQSGILNTAIGAASGQYVSGSYNIAMGTGAGSGTDAEKLAASQTISIGHNAKASKHTAIAMGTTAQARTEKSVALGENAIAGDTAAPTVKKGEYSTAIGSDTTALGYGATAVGSITKAKVNYATALGHEAEASGTGETSLGYGAGANSTSPNGNRNGVNLGTNAGRYAISGGNNVAVGISAGQYVEGDNNIAQGYSAGYYIKGNENVSIGTNANVGSATEKLEVSKTVAIGSAAKASANNAIALGNTSIVEGDDSIAIGHGAKNKRVLEGPAGNQQQQLASSSIAIGRNASTNFSDSIAIGRNTEAHGQSSIVIGENAKTISPWNDATNRYNQSYRSILIGFKGQSSGANTIGIGSRAEALANSTMVLGMDASSGHVDAIVMGRSAKTQGGSSASAGSIAIGTGSSSGSADNGRPSTAIGAGSYVGASFAIPTTDTSPSTDAGKETLRNAPEGIDMARGATAIGANASAAYRLIDLLKEDVTDSLTNKTVKAGTPVYRQIIRDSNNKIVEVKFYTSLKDKGDGTGSLEYSYIDKDKVNQGYAANMGTALDDNTAVLTKSGFLKNGSADPDNVTYTETRTTKDKGIVTTDAKAYAKLSNPSNQQVAVGLQARAVGNESVAVGTQTIAGDNSVVMGSSTRVQSLASNYVQVTSADVNKYAAARDTVTQDKDIDLNITASQGSVLTMYQNNVGRNLPNWNSEDAAYGIAGSTVLGAQAHSTAPIGVAVGLSSTVARGALGGVALGSMATVEPNALGSMAMGMGARVQVAANNAIALGTGAEVVSSNDKKANGAVAIGHKAMADKANSVALGAGSITSDAHTGDYTLNGLYTAAGLPVAANGTVSVGAAGKERQIQNVAAGVISATSTDAINGSQLYATNNYMNNFAGDVATKLGGNVALSSNGNLAMTNIGGTGKDNVNDAIAAANTKVAAGENITVTPTTNADGSKTYIVATQKDLVVDSVKAGDTTVNTDGVTIAGGPSITKSGINANGRKVTGLVDGDINATSTDAVNGSQLHATNTKLADVENTANTAVQEIESANPDALSVKKDGTKVTLTPNVIAGDLVDPATGAVNTPAVGDAGKLVTAGTVANALANTHFVVDTKATDGELDTASQADQKIKSGNKVTLQAGKNLKAKQTNGANGAEVEFSLKDSISLKEVTAGEGANQVVLGNDGVKVGGKTYINNDGLNANGNKITNVADGVDPTDAVNKGQLDAVKNVAGSAVQSVDVAANENNLVVDNTDPKNPKLSLKKDLTVDSVKAGDSTLNTDGLTIAGGPSVKKDGIDAGDKTITNVAPGAVTPTSKDAVNGGQLYNVANNVKDLIGPDAAIDPATGKVTVTDPAKGIGETGKGNIGDAIKHVNDAAKAAADTAKKHTTVEQGDNIVVEESTNADGGKHYKVSTAKNLNVDSVKAGDTTVNNDGVTIAGGPSVTKAGINAGGNTITNVTDGVNPTDAVNKGQLDKVAGVADSAVKSVDVANGEQNLVVDNSDPKNPKLSLKKDLTVDSVKAGDSTLNNDGLTIAGGPSVKKDGIDAGDKKITNVAAGDVAENSKDAVNGGQLYDVAKNVADLVGPDAKIDPATGKVTVTDPAKGIGETGKGNIGDAIKHVNDLAKNAADTAKKHTTVEQGDNIVVEESTNAEGGKHYKVSTAKNLNVDSVKAGDTTVNNDGVTINNGPSMTKDGINANNTKVTNVADGVDAADAVNKGQLDKVDTKVSNVAQNVVNVLGGDATVNGNGDITMTNIGETGKGNINDAIKSVNDLAKKAAAEKTSVKAKEGRSNVTVTEGVNAAGGHEYTVDVERSVTNAGSDYVTVTNNHDADSNTTTYTVDVSAKTKASLAKADSAVQGLTSKDGNLNFTKGSNGNVEVSFNDNLNVKNVTTDRVQVANGPSMSKDGINAAGKAISNVANGNVAADSKDAVNGGQLHETAKSVADVIGGGATVKDGKVVAGQNGIGNTGQNTVHGAIAAINQNTANNFNQIRGDLRKMDRDLRGGIAGALATAGLPQAFRPGKSMVAAAASTYRGQSGLAIGVSRISDNGKVILKVTGNTNSRGDFGGTIGAGYQW